MHSTRYGMCSADFAARTVQHVVRDEVLDKVRGFAILLMVLDHVLLLFDPFSWMRYTVTRAALPLFCVVAGSLLRDRVRWFRVLEIMGWGLILSVISVGHAVPDVLVVLAPALVIGSLYASPWVLILALLQVVVMPVPWTGYQPGLCVALVLVGRLLRLDLRGGLDMLGSVVPRWCAGLGRYPLSIYVGHLLLLRLVVSLK